MSLVTAVLDNERILNESKYDKVMERLKTAVKSRNKSNMEDQIERILTVTKSVQRKEGVNLNLNNIIAKDFQHRAYVKELKNGTDTLYFKSKYREVISESSQIILKNGEKRYKLHQEQTHSCLRTV